ncbi:NADP-dependent oxidoreductase [Streptomyces mobaraensis NBRC 13819 = DSM 40847]|uniref:Alcohol dehydrogenase zinc-binding domain-containing protein n=1 Tax=Streptomyces mobaraensis (strain ATCC 29032 / DSM 40847 / JCM 4168 / NBRC 13819 / NCIMB 11159 / IPCR 16-22) TaxID=1223523 RepID=M3B159_STRM1|nr:NADP-dependent oxidoreductase [Streptomyces mobaraensis]EME99677.1 alcohol dehydrogenase zinc-binding domain-containing protein [Streptomyces mobaraensis NBRC 13819 = DSM 40847]QTT76464.1 NADP-dependent oxidoreductase [Streptomyces mobaraensis NBRC 13819 = DSM 40847]
MKAAAINAFGGPEVVEPLELPTPEPGPGQVRVRVRAAGVQPVDGAVRRGLFHTGTTPAFPLTIGNDFAGVVDRTGEDADGFAADGFRAGGSPADGSTAGGSTAGGSTADGFPAGGFPVGAEVLGWAPMACHAEYVVVPVDQIVAKPAGMPWEVAGAFSASAQTAHTALELLGVGAGDTLLVHAAAGGVGTVAVQLARAYGATVIGTASPRNHDYLRSLGALPVAYGDGLVERVRALAPRGITVALDAAGGAALDASVELVADRDRIGTIVGFDRAPALGVRVLRTQRSAARLSALTGLWTEGRLRVEVSRTFPLERAADAHRAIETGHGRGKIALVMG